MKRKLCALLFLTFILFTLALPVYAAADAATPVTTEVTQEAADTSDDSNLIGMKAIACGIAISVAAGGGAVGMGIATGKAVEGLSRQPSRPFHTSSPQRDTHLICRKTGQQPSDNCLRPQ